MNEYFQDPCPECPHIRKQHGSMGCFAEKDDGSVCLCNWSRQQIPKRWGVNYDGGG